MCRILPHVSYISDSKPTTPTNEGDPIDLTGEIGSPVRNIPPQARVSVF